MSTLENSARREAQAIAPALLAGPVGGPHRADLSRWRALASGDDPRAVYLELIGDESFALRELCLDRMRAAAVLLDAERVRCTSAARLALHAPEYAGEVPLEEWVKARIDTSIVGLVDEDAIEERDDRPVAKDDERYAALAGQLGIDGRTMRRASVVFQRLPREERAVFWAVVIDGDEIERHARASRIPLRVAQNRLERAMASFCSLGARRGPDVEQDGRSAP